LPAACSAGNYAIGSGLDLIRQGEVEAVLAGGSEAFSESAFAGFSRLGAMSPDVCRPFDRNRRGLLLGEGAGFLVLESEAAARRRGARPLARILGYGLSCDAHHITAPHPEGEGAASCMAAAIEDAGLSPAQVDYICCHGTGTRHNDAIEARAIRRVFREAANRVAASSIKALTGHMMGAASAVEAVACVWVLREGILPPTWHLEEQDPECDLDVIPNAPREAAVEIALNNSYAFGGNNACLALGRP
jgi:3-oxoacyl-[acyl-carrier-protein] synthase II